jgi:hypothetical protein
VADAVRRTAGLRGQRQLSSAARSQMNGRRCTPRQGNRGPGCGLPRSDKPVNAIRRLDSIRVRAYIIRSLSPTPFGCVNRPRRRQKDFQHGHACLRSHD